MAESQDASRSVDLDAVVANPTDCASAANDREPSPLEGRLFRYRTSPYCLQAFESPVNHSYSRYCIYIGGLTDGLLACSYVDALAAECDSRGWALVQPVITSSYKGYGCSSVKNDAHELAQCLEYLKRTRDVSAFAVIGHSTGCQDIVHLLASAPVEIRKLVRAAVLQAPVSDREAASLEDDADGRDALLKEAQTLVGAGRGETLLSKMHYGFVPITAERYASLVGRGGPDDLFSSDFTDAELRNRLGHLSTAGQREARGELATEPVVDHPGLKILFVHGLGEEYVPPHVDAKALSKRFIDAAGLPDARALLVEDGNHNLSKPAGAASKFIAAVGSLLDEAMDRVLKLDEDF
eukprot:TRINITY_DN29366_c0_g1_i1.p1 TRINITY_DN29366_c0_g1~~TRINITY_DN29366_c0_g1_i1.p1  ORF type:complete len:382 (+),score=50.72 TRINITY_DN29366_c0_g1_i1:91-1146(+)